jgi:hypothetical protein
MGNGGGVMAADKPCHKQPCSAEFILPPLSILVFRPERAVDKVVAEPEAAPEKTPEVLPGASPVASASAVVASPTNPALDPGKAPASTQRPLLHNPKCRHPSMPAAD